MEGSARLGRQQSRRVSAECKIQPSDLGFKPQAAYGLARECPSQICWQNHAHISLAETPAAISCPKCWTIPRDTHRANTATSVKEANQTTVDKYWLRLVLELKPHFMLKWTCGPVLPSAVVLLPCSTIRVAVFPQILVARGRYAGSESGPDRSRDAACMELFPIGVLKRERLWMPLLKELIQLCIIPWGSQGGTLNLVQLAS